MAAKIDNNGFSLAEAMVVIAIMGIMSAIAIPPLLSWMSNKGLQSAARDVYSNLRKAQSTAVKDNRNCALSINSNGYDVYVDGNKNFNLDAGELIIANVPWSQYRNVVFDSATGIAFNTEVVPRRTIAFQPNLIPVDRSGAFSTGTVKLKNSTPRQLEVVVNVSGNITLR